MHEIWKFQYCYLKKIECISTENALTNQLIRAPSVFFNQSALRALKEEGIELPKALAFVESVREKYGARAAVELICKMDWYNHTVASQFNLFDCDRLLPEFPIRCLEYVKLVADSSDGLNDDVIAMAIKKLASLKELSQILDHK